MKTPHGQQPPRETRPVRRPSTAARAFAAAWLALFALLSLAACSGGGGMPPTAPIQNPPGQGPTVPTIQEFTADKAACFIGERAALTVRFAGGTGRIEPNVGAVQRGLTVQTEARDGAREVRLVVENAQGGGTVTRALRLPVDYRDRYREVPMQFTSRGHTATRLTDGRILIVGGENGGGALLGTALAMSRPDATAACRSRARGWTRNSPPSSRSHSRASPANSRAPATGGRRPRRSSGSWRARPPPAPARGPPPGPRRARCRSTGAPCPPTRRPSRVRRATAAGESCSPGGTRGSLRRRCSRAA